MVSHTKNVNTSLKNAKLKDSKVLQLVSDGETTLDHALCDIDDSWIVLDDWEMPRLATLLSSSRPATFLNSRTK